MPQQRGISCLLMLFIIFRVCTAVIIENVQIQNKDGENVKDRLCYFNLQHYSRSCATIDQKRSYVTI